MKSVTTPRFKKAFDKLPINIQTRAKNSYLIWKENPQHPSLHYKQIHNSEPIYSVRIGLAYRALGRIENETMIWFWIGSHEEFNSMINNL
jgi:mRNA-degrading endonuclease RelE of RelBE toxin-antitoxin system